jgi:hypothetical protein
MANYSNSRDYDAAKARRMAAIGLDINGDPIGEKNEHDLERDRKKAEAEAKKKAAADALSVAYLKARLTGLGIDEANEHCEEHVEDYYQATVEAYETERLGPDNRYYESLEQLCARFGV